MSGSGGGGQPKIRRLELPDLPELVTLCREHAAFERASWQEGEREAGLRELLLENDRARCWVVDAGERLAGFATISLELATWDARLYMHLDCLYLRDEFRGRGIGRRLIERVARAALDAGAVNLQWQTPVWNDGAVRFYRRLGAVAAEKLRFTLSPEGCAELAGRRGTDAARPSATGDRSTVEVAGGE